jgi:plasmid stabilization system protein ParE
MTVRVIRSRRADAEIEEIAADLAEHSPPAAERFLNELTWAYQLLSEHLDLGPAGMRPGTRRLIVGNYIVSYRRRGENLEIFAVKDAGRRDARF